MSAFKYNIEIEEGATLEEIVTWKAGELKTPVDLTGCTARMQVREKINSPAVLLELTTLNGGIVLGGTAGTIKLYMLAANTLNLTWKNGVYDLYITFPSGVVKKKLYGTVSYTESVTQ